MGIAGIEGRGLAAWRGGRLVFAALDFDIGAGAALVVTGPNGSGKSTLLRLVAGLVPAFAGLLAWDGQRFAPASDPVDRARVLLLGHADAIKPTLTVGEHASLLAELLEAPREQVSGAIDRLGLAPLRDLPAGLLSAGQRRRVGLLRFLLSDAPLWLADEPTVGLDRDAVQRFEALVGEHRALGGMVMLATHVPLDLPGAAVLDLTRFAEAVALEPA